MSEFDSRLRDGLMDANLLDYASVLGPAGGPDLSPRLLRERTRLLADPFGWARRRGRPLWKRAARTAACAALACAVALGSLMAVSPDVRAAVLSWLREISGNLVTYSPVKTGETAQPQDWRLTWVPEGWQVQSLYIGADGFIEWHFLHAETGSLSFSCSAPGDQGSSFQLQDMEDPEASRETVSVQGCSADYYAGDIRQYLVWEGPDGFLFSLTGPRTLDRETFLTVADSAARCEDDAPAYEMTWVPPELVPMDRSAGSGVFQQNWSRNGVLTTWQYIARPICPFFVPEGTEEAVTVNGRPARYWANQEEIPEAEEGADPFVVEAGGATIVVGGGSAATSGTLMWEDPETGTAFRLTGELSREALIQMAESVQRLGN